MFRTCFSQGNVSYLNNTQDDYSVEAPGFQDKYIKLNESSMTIFRDWNRFRKLVDFRTNTWKLNESCQSLYHQSLDIKRYDEVWWGESGGRKTEGYLTVYNLKQKNIQHTWPWKWNGLGMDSVFSKHFFSISLTTHPWQLRIRLLWDGQAQGQAMGSTYKKSKMLR